MTETASATAGPGAGVRRHAVAHDLLLPTLLFAALGGMAWAVRGCSGFGAVPGCVFAGVTWGAAWWYLAQNPDGRRTRRYDSGWVVLALTIGIGLSGERGWMQWPSFFDGRLVTNYDKHEFVTISRNYGFLWLFLAGVPWAGLGACLLAWCGSRRETRLGHWAARVACGVGGAVLARHLITTFPQFFLPLYDSLAERYRDTQANPSLRRLVNDCTAAVTHLGCYLGLLLYEVVRREGKNVVLILTVGLVNGLGWALCQNWTWAAHVWPPGAFNFWRCWESSGGISIGTAYGLAYALVNRPMSEAEGRAVAARRSLAGPGFEWLLVYLGLGSVLGLLLIHHLGGWGRLYFGVVLPFGGGYYLWGRRSAGEATAGAGHALVATALTAALTAVPFLTARNPWWVGWAAVVAVVALGAAWYVRNRPVLDAEALRTTPPGGDPGLERLGLALGVFAGLALSARNGAKGWCNIYLGHEQEWNRWLWDVCGPTYLGVLALLLVWALVRSNSRRTAGRGVRHAYGVVWLVLAVQYTIALLITGPLTVWSEMAFAIYYVLLFFISAVVVFHFRVMKEPAA